MQHNIKNISLNYNAVDYIVKELQNKSQTDIINTTLIVPTRRFGYFIKEALASKTKQGVGFLPNTLTVEDLIKQPLIKDASFYESLASLKPKYSSLEKKIALYKLLKAKYAKSSPASIIKMAESLEDIIDDAALNNVDFAELENLTGFETSEHFRQNLEFLKIIYKVLPSYLEIDDIKKLSRIYFQEQALKLQIELIKKHKPKQSFIAIGLRSLSKNLCLLLKEIAKLENGSVVFYGLDFNTKENLSEQNPQYIYAKMLSYMGFDLKEVKNIENTSSLNCHHNIAYSCFNKQPNNIEGKNFNIQSLNCKTKEEESLKAALVLKKAFLNNEKSCIVSYDNSLLLRVDSILKSWGIFANNSLGVSLAKSKNTLYFLSAFNLFFNKFNTLNFSSFIKNPLASFGLSRKESLKAARIIDKNILRNIGISIYSFKDLQYHVNQNFFVKSTDDKTLQNCKHIIEQISLFFEEVAQNKYENNAKKLQILYNIAISCSFDENKKANIFKDQEGLEIKKILSNFEDKIENFENLALSDVISFIVKDISKVTIRTQHSFDKNISIMSPLESYMLNFDTMVIAGANDGIWPKKSEITPWLGKATIKSLNLSSKDEKTGNYAFYFAKSLCNNNVFITKSSKSGYSSRFLVALENKCLQNKFDLNSQNNKWHIIYKKALEENEKITKYNAVYPTINHNLKNNVSVTLLETWHNNPFEFFVKHVLNLKETSKLHESNKSIVFGNIVHTSLEEVIKNAKTLNKNNLLQADVLEEVINKNMDWHTKDALFILQNQNNIKNIAKYATNEINLLVKEDKSINLYSELEGSLAFKEHDTFVKTRLDFATSSDDNVVNIVDFKTGSKNSRKRVQLSLVKHILHNKGFDKFENTKINENTKYNLNYIFVKAQKIDKENEINVKELIENFYNASTMPTSKESYKNERLNVISRSHEK